MPQSTTFFYDVMYQAETFPLSYPLPLPHLIITFLLLSSIVCGRVNSTSICPESTLRLFSIFFKKGSCSSSPNKRARRPGVVISRP